MLFERPSQANHMDEAAVRECLSSVIDPALEEDIVSLGLVESITIDETISVEVALGGPTSPQEATLLEEIREALATLERPAEVLPVKTSRDADSAKVLGSISNVIAVASGKGGVGKTTVSVNIAAGLAERGASVGLFDADVYGPNAPMMLGGIERPSVTEDEQLIPPEIAGMQVMSMGYLVGEDDPIIWRGPMVHKVLTQLWEDVAWGDLDYLVVDLPPGTGDTQLTLLQTVPVTGAVIVTTPQQMALHDARKGLEMFAEHGTNVLGIVENMAGFRCPDCGSEHNIFDHGGGERIATQHDLPFLGSIPIDPAVGTLEDEDPIVITDEGAVGEAFCSIVANVADSVGIVNRRSHRQLKEQTPSD